MIVKLRFSNFYSYAEETEISFELGKKPAASYYDIEVSPDRRLNKVVAVMGANGSGKTNLIHSISFLSWFISESYLGAGPDEEISYSAHALSEEREPTRFELTFLHSGEEYQYRLELCKGVVRHESLHHKTSHLFSYVFSRDLEAKGNSSAYIYKQKGFGFDAAQAKQVRSNASLIAAAYSYDVPLATELARYFTRYECNMFHAEKQLLQRFLTVLKAGEMFAKEDKLRAKMEPLMCEFDLGIDSIIIEESTTQSGYGSNVRMYMPIATHIMDGQEFKLSFMEESSGTRSAFVLLARILTVLEHGGVAIIDEIDDSLHPHMLPRILDLFKFEHTNPHQAQLIFTCHAPELLNRLRKHQIYLTEKYDQKSEAWRLDDVKGLRADDNLYAKYMAGALEAIPDF